MGVNVHIYPSHLVHDSRILRSVEVIDKLGFFDKIIVCGVARKDLPEEEFRSGNIIFRRFDRRWFAERHNFLAKLIKTLEWSTRVYRFCVKEPVSLVNPHSLAVLPLCVAIKVRTGARLVYDEHELATEVHYLSGVGKRIGKIVERVFIRWANEVIVVSNGIARWYASAYPGVQPVVVRNIPPLRVDGRAPIDLKGRLGLAPQDILFIYQGGFVPGRGIERLVGLFGLVRPRAHLVLMGTGPLQAFIDDAARQHANIHVIPAVPPAEVLKYTSGADVGVCLTEKSCLSHEFSLPNKLFEYIQAGIPLIVPDLTEQRAIVEGNGFGWVLDEDDQKAATFLSSLTHGELREVSARVRMGSSKFSWDQEKQILVELYTRLMSTPKANQATAVSPLD